MSEIKSFEDLECFKYCKLLRQEISSMVKTFPNNEQYRLTDQILRCSRSVTNNIAEGFGRFHYKENAQFCRHARGSLFELLDHLQIGFEEGYIEIEKLNKLTTQANDCIRILNGFIKYLVSQSLISKTL
ncbi:MAG: four helix bundle protein [Bacteroidota bacterium]